ncbi:MAG: hypothetical protein NVS4B3_22460 [Gemmatimonadaceae bacterium]
MYADRGVDVKLATRILAGMTAAAFATYVMDAVGEAMYARESDAAKRKEAEAEPKSALAVLSERAIGTLGREATEEGVKRLSNAIHWAFGTGNGIMYALLDDAVPAMSMVLGVPFALGLFAFDELGLPAFGLTPKPAAFPTETHVRALANHLAFGAVLAVTFRGLTHLGTEHQS